MKWKKIISCLSEGDGPDTAAKKYYLILKPVSGNARDK